jgi:pyruvate formate lyase activating enzyme
MSANEVMETVLRDRPFYEATGGGLTVSGGEPLMQVDFTRALLSSAKEHGLHTCLDTAGWGGDAAELVPLVDLFLWDVKATDPDVHLEVTGVPWKPIEENLLRTDARGGSMRLRCPIIPGINAHARHMRAIAALAERLRGVQGIDLIPYHDLGQAKALAIERAAPRYEKLTPEDRETLLAELRANTKVPCGWHQ